MKRFKAFLIEQYEEGGRTSPITEAEAVSYVKKNSPVYLENVLKNNDAGIFRGVAGKKDPFLFGDSSAHVRQSANTLNYYTLLMDHILPSWKFYPNRSKSFICSTSIKTAKNYGKAYTLFPPDGTIVGVADDNDLWNSFQETYVDPDRFNDFLEEFAKLTTGDILSESDPKILKKSITNIENKLKKESEGYINRLISQMEKYHNYFFTSYLKYIKEGKNIDLITYIDNKFDPKKNGFSTVSSEKIPSLNIRDKEVWFSGEAVFIYGLDTNLEDIFK